MSERTKNPRESRSFVSKWKLFSLKLSHRKGVRVPQAARSKEGKEMPSYPHPPGKESFLLFTLSRYVARPPFLSEPPHLSHP